MLIGGLSLSQIDMQLAYADPLKSSIRQVIGNYNMEMKTDPKTPIAGQTSKILLRISSVNGDDLVDLPIMIRIAKDGIELQQTHQIIVPYGHYTYGYSFSHPGIYSLDVKVNDTAYSGQDLDFTFPINVSSSLASYTSSLSLPLVVTISIVITGVIFLNRKMKKEERRKSTIENTKG